MLALQHEPKDVTTKRRMAGASLDTIHVCGASNPSMVQPHAMPMRDRDRTSRSSPVRLTVMTVKDAAGANFDSACNQVECQTSKIFQF